MAKLIDLQKKNQQLVNQSQRQTRLIHDLTSEQSTTGARKSAAQKLIKFTQESSLSGYLDQVSLP